ncbi:putative peptide maturation dehydrogenase [Pseudoxanthomonas daejeonensis]|uniref:Peptide maturation dehydrogenase n=1 Tax=Pseudoxanthomonas daejeonensis TaxID=266062 RepID=A0ABQ6ZBG3_9GAMM|nr:putative peptide maturation dehydrogenase [Pseudoxanthomonas daejeonensis]KAF1697428.1 putative peptide maturation dehydrogenase [Pseudoxanthomonas daejeonensis]
MRIRRCGVVYLEPRESVRFDLANLLEGGNGVVRDMGWIALAPHTGREHSLDPKECKLFGQLSPQKWVELETFPDESQLALARLVHAGLVVADDPAHAYYLRQDDALRSAHWHPLSALVHGLTRWSETDSVAAMRKGGTETAAELRAQLGPPPPERIAHEMAGESISLPRSNHVDFDRLLRRRTTCRNFDLNRTVPLELTAQLLERVFSAHASVRVTEDTVFLKKSSPSGGGLHPVEAYLLIRDVAGVQPGLYHYDPVAHALRHLPDPVVPLQELMLRAVAAQDWFADAHVMVVMAPRYARNFWKYRQHPKAYRAVLLEAGHLSQTLYLSATEAGLAAYVTCAINETWLDEAFGLDSMNEGALAVCGFGWRAPAMETMELDPLGEVWKS